MCPNGHTCLALHSSAAKERSLSSNFFFGCCWGSSLSSSSANERTLARSQSHYATRGLAIGKTLLYLEVNDHRVPLKSVATAVTQFVDFRTISVYSPFVDELRLMKMSCLAEGNQSRNSDVMSPEHPRSCCSFFFVFTMSNCGSLIIAINQPVRSLMLFFSRE